MVLWFWISHFNLTDQHDCKWGKVSVVLFWWHLTKIDNFLVGKVIARDVFTIFASIVWISLNHPFAEVMNIYILHIPWIEKRRNNSSKSRTQEIIAFNYEWQNRFKTQNSNKMTVTTAATVLSREIPELRIRDKLIQAF